MEGHKRKTQNHLKASKVSVRQVQSFCMKNEEKLNKYGQLLKTFKTSGNLLEKIVKASK